MAGAKKLVGASGFLGSHVTRQLVERSDDVRVIRRRSSSTKAIDDLIEKGDVDCHNGDIFDDAAVRNAMAGCDDVYYCVVESRGGGPNRSRTRSAGQRIFIGRTDRVADRNVEFKTGSGLRMTRARPGMTINVCPKNSH